MADFVHLHLHSEYSLLDGVCRIGDIPRLAKQQGQNAVALTDHGAMYGAVEFYRACRAEGVKPILGCEVYVAPRSRFDREPSQDQHAYHLVLLVQNEVGYRNLITLVSKGYTEGFYSRPRVDLELLAEHAEGLFALSACLGGRIPQYILQGDMVNATVYAEKLKSIFGDRFYLELQNHKKTEDLRVCNGLRAISQKTGIALVVTNDVHYPTRADAETQAVLMCIQTNRTMSEGRPEGFDTDELYFKSGDEMASLFPDDTEAIENTVKIAERCNFDFDFDKLYLPKFPTENGESAKAMLRRLASEGLRQRLKNGDIQPEGNDGLSEYKSRMEYELFIIGRMGYDDYFLIVHDFVNESKRRGIPVGPGRGSGAGSLVAYLLRITEIDPIRFGLLFERFLNPERVSMPDFDIDFGHERRGEAVEYVASRYGADRVAQICAFDTLAARAAIRDVGRAIGMSYADVDAVAKLIPKKPGTTLAQASRSGELKQRMETDAGCRSLVSIAASIEGMPRHISTHAAGVVISDRPVSEYVPLCNGGGLPLIQYNMDVVASLGLLKFDFLGLRYLTVLTDAVTLIQKKEPSFDLEKIPDGDTETFAMLSQGRCGGVFQLESAGMRQMLMQFRPRNISDIMAAIALYRPGPMESIPKYLENRRSPDGITYEIPRLEPILHETFGCIVYQEQVMQICRTVANYSYGRADMIRRAMAKKKPEAMAKEREGFINGAKANFISEEAASRLFDSMSSFASYAFNKSHAACYAVTSYRTAYLKAHYPGEYLAALLCSVPGNQPKMAEYVEEARLAGLEVGCPDVNSSECGFSVGNGVIRFGLLALKNVGNSFAENIVRQRKLRPFSDFSDFMERCSGGEFNRRALESVIRAGGCDSLGLPRSVMLASFETVLDKLSAHGHGEMEGQLDLFGDESKISRFTYPDLPELALRDKIAMETEVAGWSFSGHLSDEFTEHMNQLHTEPMGQLRQSEDDTDTSRHTVGGILTRRVVKQTRKGEDMCFITLEDRSGSMEVLCFPELMKRYGALLHVDAPLAVLGTLSVREEEPAKLLAQQILPLTANGGGQYPLFSAPTGRYSESDADRTRKPARQITEEKPKISVLYLSVSSTSDDVCERIRALADIFPGAQEIVLFDEEKHKYYKDRSLKIHADDFVLSRLKSLLGENKVVCR